MVKGITKATVTEVKSLSSPPQLVKDTVVTTLLLLGHFEEETKRYQTVQALLAKSGADAIMERTRLLKTEDVPLNVALGARLWMKDITAETVMKVSKAASEFHRWNQAVTEEVLSRYSEEEISKTEPRTKLHTEPEPEQT